jgi:hypothetical protein
MNADTSDAISASISAADSITTLCDELYEHIGTQTPTLALVDGIKALAEKVDRLLVEAQGSDAAPTPAPAPAQGGPGAAAHAAGALLTAMAMGESLRVLVRQVEELDEGDRFPHSQAMEACIEKLLAAVIPAHGVAAAEGGAA